MPTRIALLGSGIFATSFYLPVLLKSSEVDIRALWSRSKASADKIKALATNGHLPPVSYHGTDGLDALLESDEIEAVIMALPISAQPDLIVRCLRAGKHVLSEKPVAKDVKTARDLIATYEKEFKPKGLVWRVAESRSNRDVGPVLMSRLCARANLAPSERAAQDAGTGPRAVLAGATRAVCRQGFALARHIMAEHPGLPRRCAYFSLPPGPSVTDGAGFILDGGVHMTALLRVVLPVPPATIISTASLHRAHLPPHDLVMALALPPVSSGVPPLGEPLSGDLSIIPVPSGKSSPQGSIVLSWAKPNTPAEGANPGYGLFITLENAEVSIEMEGSKFIVNLVAADDSGIKSRKIEGESSGIKEEVEQFARAARGNTEEVNRGSPQDALWDLGVIQALLSSDGKPVDLERLVAA